MDMAMQSVKKTPGTDHSGPRAVPNKVLKKEFDMFEASSVRSHNLEALLDSLNTIPPSSVESERYSAFEQLLTFVGQVGSSQLGQFVSKCQLS